MSDTEEIAKAVQSVANLGDKSLDTAQKLGGFVSRVFQEPIAEMAGIVTDKLRFIRWKNLVTISDQVNALLEERAVYETKAVPPKLALPIFDEGTLEEDTELQKLWIHLLANAMDPSYNGDVRYGFIDMIKNITATEASILNHFYATLSKEGHIRNLADITNYFLSKEQIIQLTGIDIPTYQVSAYNLMRMQCIAPAILKGGAFLGDEPMTIYKGVDAVVLTPLGVKFIEACIK